MPSYSPEDSDHAHIDDPSAYPDLSTYPSTPPASGPHALSPLPAGVYGDPPDVYATIHSLEHGAVVVWLSPEDAPFAGSDFFRDPENIDHVVVAPYDYPDQGASGSLPEGKAMALVSWHHVQLCDDANVTAVEEFLSQYRFPTLGGGEYLGDAPEQGAPI